MPLSLGIKTIVMAATSFAAVAGGFLGLVRECPAPFPTVIVTTANGATLEAGREEITQALWMDCVKDGECSWTPDFANASATMPVTDVNALDIAEFITWLNSRTHGSWRLPTREEAQSFAALLPQDPSRKLFTDPRMAWAADYSMRKDYGRALRPSGAFGTVANGLADIAGNVWEWTSTCTAKDIGDFPCPAYYVNGEHEVEIPTFLRDAVSGGCAAGLPPTHLGFRLVTNRKN